MYRGVQVAVVIPAHNEAVLIGRVLAGIPAYVDQVLVVDDASKDETCERVLSHGDPRVRLVLHATNRGVGAAIVTGYRLAREQGAEVIAVLAGDDQMDPEDLESVLLPVVEGRVDYVKGDRLHHSEVGRMPLTRRLGTLVLTEVTRRALHLPSLSDSQCGYTAISGDTLDRLDLGSVWPGFGYPNDLLARIVHQGFRYCEVVVRPVYKNERSDLRPWHLLTILGVVKRARKRALNKGL